LCRAVRRVESNREPFSKTLEEVAVAIERHGDGRVAKELRDRLGMRALMNQERRAGVP
jgi:hypothetical protein